MRQGEVKGQKSQENFEKRQGRGGILDDREEKPAGVRPNSEKGCLG